MPPHGVLCDCTASSRCFHSAASDCTAICNFLTLLKGCEDAALVWQGFYLSFFSFEINSLSTRVYVIKNILLVSTTFIERLWCQTWHCLESPFYPVLSSKSLPTVINQPDSSFYIIKIDIILSDSVHKSMLSSLSVIQYRVYFWNSFTRRRTVQKLQELVSSVFYTIKKTKVKKHGVVLWK